MADKIVIIKLDVQEAGASAQIQKLNTDLSKLTKGTEEYDLVLKKIAIQEDRLINIQAKRASVQKEATQSTKAAQIAQENFNRAIGTSSVLAHKNSEQAIQTEITRLNTLRSTMDTASKSYVEMGNRVSLLQQKLKTAKTGVDGFSASSSNSSNVLNRQKDATGSATAATMELSRVVSDAPYGIRGMANNITQLVSQLGSASTKAGGLSAALKLMWKSMMGPLGVVFAITAVVSALDYFYGANKKAEGSVDDLKSSFEGLATALDKGLNVSVEDYVKLLDKKKVTDDKLIASQKRLIEIEEALNEAVKDRIYWEKVKSGEIQSAGQGELALAGNILRLTSEESKLREEKNKIIKDGADEFNSLKDATDKLNRSQQGSINWLKEEISIWTKLKEASKVGSSDYVIAVGEIERMQNRLDAVLNKNPLKGTEEWYSLHISNLEKVRKATAANSKEYKEQTASIAILQKELDKLTGGKEKPDPDDASIPFTAKWYEQKIALETKRRNEFSKTNKQYLAGTEKIAELQKKLDEIEGNRKKANILVDLDLKPVRIDEIEKQAKKKLEMMIEALVGELDKDPLKINVTPNLDLELSDDAKARIAEYNKEIRNSIALNSKLDDAKNFLDKSKEILGSMTSFISGEYDREMTIEQNKTNALNQELNNRLLNENLSKDERAKIQNQIAQNDEKLRVKQESINRKKFNTEKAANIAMTLMNTATAAVGVMKDAKGGFFARLAQAIPTIAFGLAQVATIARTKYQSSSPASPANASIGSGGSGGDSGRAEPSFNIVGRSNENILLNAIQAQFDKPLKAYVVARDVTNQQQLDGIISNTSSI